MNEFITNLNPVITYLAPYIGGIVSAIIITKISNRQVVIAKKVFNQRIAFASNTQWGEIQVLYNGAPSNDLYLITAELHNENSKDLEEIKVEFSVNEGTTIYANSGYLYQDEVSKELLLNDAYYQSFVNTSSLNQNRAELNNAQLEQLDKDVNFVTRHKFYELPVFNRKTYASFNFLVESFQGGEPDLNVLILKKGVKLSQYQDEDDFKKQRTMWVNLVGSLFFFAGTYFIYKYSISITHAVWLMLGNNFLMYAFGWATFYFKEWWKKLIT